MAVKKIIMKQKYQTFSKVWNDVTMEFVKIIAYNSITGEYTCINKREIKIFGLKENQLSI